MKTNNVFSQAVDASVRALFDTHMQSQDAILYGPSLGFTQYEPDVPAEQVSQISGPGRARLTIEGQQYASNQRYKGYPVTVTMDKFTSELKWTEEDIHWLQKQGSSKRLSTLTNAISGAEQALNGAINVEASKVYYLGHGTTNLTGGDGLSLYNAAHLIRAGGTQANNFGSGNTHLPFTASNFVDATILMDRFQGHNGVELRPCRKLRIVCSKELEPAVQQALMSLYGPANANLGLQTGSAQAFAARGKTVDYVVAPDIPYAFRNYWQVIDLERAQEMAFMAVGWMPRMSEQTDKSKGVFMNEASTYFGFYFNSWQWTFGSIGNNSVIA